MVKGHPCKIIDMSTSKTGKHGHAKVNLTAIGIFDGKKYEMMQASTHNVDVPNVSRVEYDCNGVDDEGYLDLMTPEGDMRNDIKCEDPELLDELRKKIEEMDNGGDFIVMVTVLCAMDKEKPIAIKQTKA